MKKRVAAVLAGCALLATVAAPTSAADLGRLTEPGPGYFASDNVEWVTNIPLHVDGPGARIVGKYMYVTTSRDLTIYDISTPESPQRVGFLPFLPPQQPYFPQEDVDTNGKILLYSAQGTLNVVDVRDKANPTIIGSVAGADEHTISCVLDCKWAYGAAGVVVDLRKPTEPKIAGNWSQAGPGGGGHDVTEVRPGIVMTSTNPIMMLDARRNPAKPKVLALGSPGDSRFIHGNLWPRKGKDKFLLVGGETGGPASCADEDAGAFMTWDATKWKKTRTLRMIDEYRVKSGLPTDGDAMIATYCTHWFDPHPTFRNGGLVAMGWYEHGTRFLDVSRSGKISEKGYFLPVGGSTSAAYWVTPEIVYTLDYQRGLDILRFTGKV